MDIYIIILRVIHVLGAVFWVGSALLLFFFVGPTARNTAPEGHKFMSNLMQQGRLATWIGVAAAATIISGILAYLKESNGFKLSWITSSAGVQFTIGGIAGIIAFLLGIFIIGPNTNRMSVLGQEIEKNGGPTLDQTEELGRIQKTMAIVEKIDLILIVSALILMVIAPEFTN